MERDLRADSGLSRVSYRLERADLPEQFGRGTALEHWDQGSTPTRCGEIAGYSNNGVVEPCEVNTEPYYYYGTRFPIRCSGLRRISRILKRRWRPWPKVEDGDIDAVDRDWRMVDENGAPVPVGA